MNKHAYRIIYSQVRGMFIAVAEIVKSRCKASGQSKANTNLAAQQQAEITHFKKMNALNFAVLTLLGATIYSGALISIVQAQIVADHNAPNSQQPIILNSSNGTPQINIQTPSAGGVSRNTYSQFDVEEQGAILNNARNNTQTQIGGWVQGNPWLAKGEAKVILNEVNSSNPSQLRGYIEVAGKQAQVVIANPSGLVCDGCGVINADRFTLTTGEAVINQGYLESFRVRDGQVTIAGKGLNGSLTPYTDIYSRALLLNAGLYANSLNTVLGVNDIQFQGRDANAAPVLKVTPANTATKSQFALDIGQMGGMYAGKIFLVGNEHGLGMRNAGSINSSTEKLVLTSSGDLINTGNVIANKDQVQIQAQNIQNSGNMSSATAQVTINSQNLDNAGLISSADELHLRNNNALNNNGKLNAARIVLDSDTLKNTGSIEQTGLQALGIQAGKMTNIGGKIGIMSTPEAGSGNAGIGAGGSGSTIKPVTPTNPAKDGGSLAVIDANNTPVKSYEAGYIHVKQSFANDGAKVAANGGIDLVSVDGLNNERGQLGLAKLTVKGENFNNNAAKLTVKQGDIQTQNFTNVAGQLVSNQNLNIQAQNANNLKGQIQSVGQLDINVVDALVNTEGKIASNADVNLTAKNLNNQRGVLYSKNQVLKVNINQNIDNTAGLIQAKNHLNLISQNLNNSSGKILADQISQKHQLVNNTNGAIAAKENLDSRVVKFENNKGQIQAKNAQLHHEKLSNSGRIYIDQNLAVNSQSLNNTGSIAAGQQIAITAKSLVHQNEGLIAAGLDRKGKLGGSGNLSIKTDQAKLNGQSFAGRNIQVDVTQSIDAANAQLQAQNIMLNSATGNISTQAATVIAQDQLKIVSQAAINNHLGKMSANDLVLTAKQLDNSQGKIQHIGTKDFRLAFANGLNNQAGEILTNANSAHLSTSAFNNTLGKLTHAGKNKLNIQVNQLEGTQGQIISNGELNLKASQLILDEAVTSADQINMTADRLSHLKGQMVQSGNNNALNLKIGNNLNNQQGLIAGQKGLNIQARSAHNQTGKLLSGQGDLNLTIQNSLDNSQTGQIVSGGSTFLKAGSIDNSSKGQINAKDNLAISSQQAINNQLGQMVANQTVSMNAQGLDNSKGQIGSSQGKLRIDTAMGDLINQTGVLQAAKEMDLKVKAIDNQAGLINSQTTLNINTLKDINNSAGQIIANQDINLQSQGLNSNQGQIGSVKGAIKLDTGHGDFTNQYGKLQSARDLSLKAQHIDNQSGLIAAQKKLALNSQSLNNLKGQIQSADAIKMDAQSLNNQGGEIASNADLTLGVNGVLDNKQAGILSSGTSIIINAGSMDNSNKGQIIAKENLTISSLKDVNNQSGAMIANQEVSIQSQGLNNSHGRIGSIRGQLSIDSGQDALLNTSGSLQAGDQLYLNSRGLNNDQGNIVALADSIIVSTADITNKSGQIASNALSSISSKNLNNQSGIIKSGQDAELELVLDGVLDNSRAGQIHSGAALQIQSFAADNKQKGQITAKDRLVIESVGEIENQSGQMLANQSIDIKSRELNNNQGKIGSVQSHLNIDTDYQALSNQSGLLQAKTDVTIQAGSLDNTFGQISSQAKVDLHSQQHFSNSKGLIVGDEGINLNSQGLSNIQGQILTQDNISVDAGSRALQNQTGMLLSGKNIHLIAGDVDNSSEGEINAQDQLDVTIQGMVYNYMGLITANNILNLRSDGFNNIQGHIVSTNANLNIQAGLGRLNNLSGTIQTLKSVNIKANGIYNDLGQISALKIIDLDSNSQNLTNLNGVMSAEKINIRSGELNNDQGLIQANSDINIDSNYQILTNTNSGQQGGILSQGNITLKNIGQMNNGFGYVISEKDLKIDAIQVDNNLGYLAAANNFKIQEMGSNQQLNNQAGEILSSQDFNQNRNSATEVSESLIFENEIKDLLITENPPRVDRIESGQYKDLSFSNQAAVKMDMQINHQNKQIIDLKPKENLINIVATQQKQGQFAKQTQVETGTNRTKAPDLPEVGESFEIRTIKSLSMNVPNNAIYQVNADSQANYLIETAPAFSQYQKWLSSDYMLKALDADPVHQQKRLEDGFYEQRMLQDQVLNLTGYRFWKDYSSDEDQYKDLMNKGATSTKLYGLRPGIALSPTHVALLTSDIVWLVEKTATLQDGTVSTVLAPQVYVKARVGDLKGDGSLFSGNRVNFKLDGDFINTVTVAGREEVQISTQKDANIQGNKVGITTPHKVGENIDVATTTATSENQIAGTNSSIKAIDRVASLYVSNGTKIDVSKAIFAVDIDGNTVLKGAKIVNTNGASIKSAKGDVD